MSSADPKLLNVGGHDRSIPLPPQLWGFRQVLLDIDPAGEPDLVADARELLTLEPAQFGAVYCSHNLEHYHQHEVPRVLQGFVHVLRDGGFAMIRVPDLLQVMRSVLERKLDLDSTLYDSPAGPMTPNDVLYGWGQEIERSGNSFFAHKTGFTPSLLRRTLLTAGFTQVFLSSGAWEIAAVATKGPPTDDVMRRFSLPRR